MVKLTGDEATEIANGCLKERDGANPFPEIDPLNVIYYCGYGLSIPNDQSRRKSVYRTCAPTASVFKISLGATTRGGGITDRSST